MTSHRDTSQPALAGLALPVLAGVVLLQAAGLVLSVLREGTPIGTWLFVELRWDEALSILLERAGTTLAVLGCLLAVLLRTPRFRLIAAGVASAWCAALAVAEWHIGGAHFTDLALPAHATRIVAPLLLGLWHRQTVVKWLLRGGIALTFTIHGLEALGLHPVFIDYLLAADRRLFGLGLQQRHAELLLRLIGLQDLALAALLLSGRRLRPLLVWMAAWGTITALSRVVQGGEGALHQTLVRTANGGLPLVLLFLSPRMSMSTTTSRMGGRLARVVLPVLLLSLPFTASAQALSGSSPGHLRLVWTEDPAHRITVSWSTSSAGSTHEVYLDTQPRNGTLASYARKVTATRNGTHDGGASYHHAEVTGLQPSTTYYFVVVSDGKASPERHFVTAPVDDRAFRLLFGGDSRTGLEDRREINRLMAQLLEQDAGIIAFAHGGDYNQSSNEWDEWSGWLEDHALTFSSSGRVLPIIPTRGNHEGDDTMFNEVFGNPGGGTDRNYYVTRLGANVTFITLDTDASIGGDQTTWLEQQLQAAQSSRWIVPSYHRPAYPAVKTPSGAKQFWVPLFEQYNVDVVCESDGHVLKRTLPVRNDKHDPTGIVYVGEGGLGVPQRTPSSQWYLKSPGMAKSAHHVQVFSFSPEKLTYEARTLGGAVEDSYEFNPRRAGTAVTPPAPESPAPTPPEPTEPDTEPAPESPTPTEPSTPQTPTTPENPTPQEPSTPQTPTTPGTEQPAPVEQQPEPVTASGCTAAAGGSLAWLGLVALGAAARRRRRG